MAGTPERVLSRDFVIAVNTGTDEVPVWTPIGGLDNDGIVIAPSSQSADWSGASDGGWEKTVPIGRGYKVTLKGSRLEAADDGTRDAGQAAVEAMQDEMGTAALLGFQISSPATTAETLVFRAWPEVTPFGGADKATWGATLNVYDKIARS